MNTESWLTKEVGQSVGFAIRFPRSMVQRSSDSGFMVLNRNPVAEHNYSSAQEKGPEHP
jgi:hypothetical protein